MAFFNEFPHTRTYDSDLAWLIKRMKEVLARMDTLEEKMAALEELVRNFIDTLNIDQLIKNYLQEMIDRGDFTSILSLLVSSLGDPLGEYNCPVSNNPRSTRDGDVNTGQTLKVFAFRNRLLIGDGYIQRGAFSAGSVIYYNNSSTTRFLKGVRVDLEPVLQDYNLEFSSSIRIMMPRFTAYGSVLAGSQTLGVLLPSYVENVTDNRYLDTYDFDSQFYTTNGSFPMNGRVAGFYIDIPCAVKDK